MAPKLAEAATAFEPHMAGQPRLVKKTVFLELPTWI
jgi:hypothetical protein